MWKLSIEISGTNLSFLLKAKQPRPLYFARNGASRERQSKSSRKHSSKFINIRFINNFNPNRHEKVFWPEVSFAFTTFCPRLKFSPDLFLSNEVAAVAKSTSTSTWKAANDSCLLAGKFWLGHATIVPKAFYPNCIFDRRWSKHHGDNLIMLFQIQRLCWKPNWDPKAGFHER